jgi:hypothetical protein
MKQSLAGTVEAMIRQGAKDLHNAIVPAFPDSQKSVDEPGLPMTPTQLQVNQGLEKEQSQPDMDIDK